MNFSFDKKQILSCVTYFEYHQTAKSIQFPIIRHKHFNNFPYTTPAKYLKYLIKKSISHGIFDYHNLVC